MSDIEVLPELKEIIGSLLFAAKKPVSAKEIRKTLAAASENARIEAAAAETRAEQLEMDHKAFVEAYGK